MNNEVSLFLLGIIIVVIPFVFSIYVASKHERETFTIEIVTDSIESVKPSYNKENFNEAKKILQLMGFSATEAKELLNKSGPKDNIDDWVKAALILKGI